MLDWLLKNEGFLHSVLAISNMALHYAAFVSTMLSLVSTFQTIRKWYDPLSYSSIAISYLTLTSFAPCVVHVHNFTGM